MSNMNPQQPHPAGPPYQQPPPVLGMEHTRNTGPGKPDRPKRFGWVAASLFALGGLTLGGLIGGGDTTTTTAEPVPTTTVTATETAQAEASAEPSKPAPKKPAAPKATMGEGTFEIGVDAPAGRYKTVAEDSCYWQRSKDDSGELDSILANDNVNDGARASVTVKRGEFFTSEGCGTWTKV